MACCAFHNGRTGFKLPRRKATYYTFSDFFIQHSQEVAPQGIAIYYQIAHDNWKESAERPDGKGVASQARRKAKGGKWNDYRLRVERNVVFLGIDRIVPHSERSQSRSYSRVFKDAPKKGWEGKVASAVGFVLGKTYDDFRYLEHSRYSLPVVRCGEITYSDFNMGAGENALFEIFSNIYSAGAGALFVLDEIEFGLHARAQKMFMKRLKEVCREMSTQVICTTHSRHIFENLPDDARFFVENASGKTRVSQGISADFVFRKMGDDARIELYIMVEDDVARSLVLESLRSATRSRIEVVVVGSAVAISRQLAAAQARGEQREFIAILDGDQRRKQKDNLGAARRMLEKPKADFNEWFEARIGYLPGDSWPESWMVQRAKGVPDIVADALSVDPEDVAELMEYGLQAGKHDEFHEISSHIGISRDLAMEKISSALVRACPGDFNEIREFVASHLM